jgi:hypothetical protein
MGKDAFTSPIARSIYVSVPLGSILPATRAIFALTDFSMRDHTTFDAAIARLDGWVLNSSDIPPDAAQRYDTACLELTRALDAYLATRLDAAGNIYPLAQEIKALQDANNAFVRSCAELTAAWVVPVSWDDWSYKSPDGLEAVSFAQAIACEYVRASGVEFEVRERGLTSETDALEVLGEIAFDPAVSENLAEHYTELADFYTWLSSEEGKRVAEALERGGAYGGVSWGREGPSLPDSRGTGGEPGGSGEPGGRGEPGGPGEPGGSEPGGEPWSEPGGEPGGGFEPGGEFVRGEPGR